MKLWISDLILAGSVWTQRRQWQVHSSGRDGAQLYRWAYLHSRWSAHWTLHTAHCTLHTARNTWLRQLWRWGDVWEVYTLSAHRVALVETMKALLHRFVRICPSCCADRFGIHLIPDCGPDLLHRTDLFGFVAQTKCFRRHNMQWVSPRNETTHLFAHKLLEKQYASFNPLFCPIRSIWNLSEQGRLLPLFGEATDELCL